MKNLILSVSLSELNHELRTVLTGILGVIDLLQSEQLTLKQKNYLEILAESANRLRLLAKNILHKDAICETSH